MATLSEAASVVRQCNELVAELGYAKVDVPNSVMCLRCYGLVPYVLLDTTPVRKHRAACL